jgi:hypothetical protein
MDITADADPSTAIATGDFNGDGYVDVVVGNAGTPNRLYLHNRTATPFAIVAGSDIGSESDDTTSIAVGDVDDDGFPDVVVGNDGQSNRLYLNNGTADPFDGVSASDIGSDTDSTQAVALVDLDGDGFLDLVAGNSGDPSRSYMNNRSASPFEGVIGQEIGTDVGATTSLAAVAQTTTAGVTARFDFLLVGRDGELNRVYGNDHADGGTSPVTLAGGAPNDSIRVSSAGRVGLGTDAPDGDSRLDVAGDVHVEGDLEVTGGALGGVVRRRDFKRGGEVARVDFDAPYDQPYVIILTAVAANPDVVFKPTVIVQKASGFKFDRGGPLDELIAFHWVTRVVGEY